MRVICRTTVCTTARLYGIIGVLTVKYQERGEGLALRPTGNLL